jgi:hypothetical protein
MTMDARDLLRRLLDEAFNRRAWHGPNLLGSLRGLTARQAARRPGRDRHSIWELALHAAYWKYVIRRRLLGLKRGSFPRTPSNFPAPPSPATDRAWKDDVAFLAREHRLLREAVDRAPLTPRLLFLIRGAAMHDVYHAGQIRLIRRLTR